MTRLLAFLPIAALAALGGCAQLTSGQLYAGKGVAKAVEAECMASAALRKSNLDAVNNALAETGKPYRATALDCDGDGEPDAL